VRLKDDLVEWLKLNHDCWRNKSLDPIIQIFRVPLFRGFPIKPGSYKTKNDVGHPGGKHG
jgi:hypothetical protein